MWEMAGVLFIRVVRVGLGGRLAEGEGGKGRGGREEEEGKGRKGRGEGGGRTLMIIYIIDYANYISYCY